MNRHESKYFNTARLMDEALVLLLSKKEYELITVKDICDKAGVNRSTFYLHYENMDDLLKECIERNNESFFSRFKERGFGEFDAGTRNVDDLILIKEEYLIPYLEFVKENKNLFQVVHGHPELFDASGTYEMFFENVFNPILERFGFGREDNRYIMEFYTNGISSMVIRWVGNGCKEDISKIVELLLVCIRPKVGDGYECY